MKYLFLHLLHLLHLLPPATSQQGGDTITLTCTVRDIGYLSEGPGHPDFGTFTQEDKGMVKEDLGADNKPQYAGNPTTVASTGYDNFQLWYNTDHRVTGDGVCGASETCPRNLELSHDVVLTYSQATGNWGFDSSSQAGNPGGFFILDNKGFQPTTTSYAPPIIRDYMKVKVDVPSFIEL